jgi:hypothetical protein
MPAISSTGAASLLLEKFALPQITVSGTLDEPIIHLANAELKQANLNPHAFTIGAEQASVVRERLIAGSR